MGSQRPMETARGVFEAVWFDEDGLGVSDKQYWTHPEKTGDDIDLPTITTNVTPKYGRAFDFHELYWAHLMDETRAVAVLLWLFELVRKGPRLKKGMRLLWWASAAFLGLLTLAVAQLALTIIALIAHAGGFDLNAFVIEPLALTTAVSFVISIATLLLGAFFSSAVSFLLGALTAGLLYFGNEISNGASYLGLEVGWLACSIHSGGIAKSVAPPALAFFVIYFLMGRWGVAALVLAMAISTCVYGIAIVILNPDNFSLTEALNLGWTPWAVLETWSTIAAALLIATYLALNAIFLQPFLGDAARYFRNAPGNVAARREIRRQAVNMLETLHLSRNYDRIIIVAHSLGTVVAYDMLRAYFGRIAKQIPLLTTSFGAEFEELDHGAPAVEDQRLYGRKIVAKIADAVSCMCSDESNALPDSPRAWLVTDFVTLGSPLTHAYYLMCLGDSEAGLRSNFLDKVRQRDFPTSPPQRLDGSGCLTYLDRSTGRRHFHHGALFALTRWTNLYFKASELLWGDAVGGRVGRDVDEREMFGDNVRDREVQTNSAGKRSFFAHVAYWSTKYPEKRQAPHLRALREAVDLEDEAFNADANG